MGFGDWAKDKLNSAGGAAEHLINKGKRVTGEAVDWGTNQVGGDLDRLGLHGAADAVEDWGDHTASGLGADVAEAELGQSEEPGELVHGDEKAIRASARHLRRFQTAFGNVGDGMRRLDPSHWRGEAADAFRAKFAMHPRQWLHAADACGDAAAALESYADTVVWAHGRARDAVEAYKAGKHASEAAADAYNTKVDTYNADVTSYNDAVDKGRDPGVKPVKPGAFHDPGKAKIAEAQELLDDARRQRDTAAGEAQAKVKAALAHAPARPQFTDRLGMDLADVHGAGRIEFLHFGGGLLKGGANLLKFARSVNPTDIYNVTHPAAFFQSANTALAGMVSMSMRPDEQIKGFVGTGWSKDPSQAAGVFTANVLSLLVPGGGEEAGAGAAARAGERMRPEPVAEAPAARPTECIPGVNEPIDVATGAMLATHTDLSLPASLPLVLRRTHRSSWLGGLFFGPAWCSILDERVQLDARGAVFAAEDGSRLVYPVPRPGERVLPVKGPRWPLEWDGKPEGAITLTDPAAGTVRTFTHPMPGGEPGAVHLLLESVQDRNGARIDIDRAHDGHPLAVHHSGGYHLAIDTDGPRITALRLLGRAPSLYEAPSDGSGTVVMRYRYDDAGNLTEVINSSGEPLRFTYDAKGRVTSWTDRNNTSFAYFYDERGRVVRTEGSDGVLSGAFDYDEAHRTTVYTNSLGHRATFRYNTDGQVTEENDPLDNTTRTSWNERGDLRTSVTDPLGRTTRYAYDEAGNLTGVTLPNGVSAHVIHNGQCRPVEVTEPCGATWRHTYDEAGNLLATTDPTGARSAYAYNERGHLVSATDPLGHTRRIVCNPAGLPVAVTDPLGNTTTVVRDAFGRITAVTDPLGRTTRTRWTVEGRPAHRIYPDGTSEAWTWDGEGNLLAHTDPAGNTTRTAYTHFDLPATRTGPDGATYHFAYDTELRLTAVTNPASLTWSYTYDPAGRLTSETDFNGRTLTYTHSPAGELLTRTNGAGQTLTYTRDLLGRATEQRTDTGEITIYAYDRAGRISHAANSDADLRIERDARGRILAETVNGRTTTYTYDPAGRTTSRTTPSGLTSTWTYDPAGRPAGLRVDAGALDFSYDAAGHESERRMGDGVYLNQAWDTADRLTAQTVIHHGKGNADRIVQHRAYAYREDGHLTQIRELTSGTRRFILDQLGRVTAVHAHGWSETYAYDTTGNLTHATAPAHHAPGDRQYQGTLLTRAGRTTYRHDAQGRLIRRTWALLNGQRRTWTYAWSGEDRLTDVTTPTGERWHYTYDPLGRRTAKQRIDGNGEAADITTFAWEDSRLAEQCDPDGRHTTWDYAPGTHRPLAQTGHTPLPAGEAGSSPIAGLTRTASSEARFHAIITDLAGTPTELLTPDGEVAWQHRTTVWGTPLPVPNSTTHCPLRFPGQYQDPETGLNYNYFRYYDPETGRYTSPDPLGLKAGPHHHRYTPNPYHWADVLGLKCTTISAEAKEHVLNGVITDKQAFAGWHLHPDQTGGIPPNRYINGDLVTNPDGSVTVDGTVGALQPDGTTLPKTATVGHTFFPKDWDVEKVIKAGNYLFEHGTYKRNGAMVQGVYEGVKMTGFLEKDAAGNRIPSTFFPTGG
jgi:RHS repeat-associated protein